MYDISWNEFEKLSVVLAKQIKQSNQKFDSVICVSRGGLLLGRLISEILELPLGVISAKYVSGQYMVDNTISSIHTIKGNILLIDDLFENTANIIKETILNNNKQIKQISLGCIFYKSKDNFEPNYFINQIKDDLWVSFPYQQKSLKHHINL